MTAVWANSITRQLPKSGQPDTYPTVWMDGSQPLPPSICIPHRKRGQFSSPLQYSPDFNRQSSFIIASRFMLRVVLGAVSIMLGTVLVVLRPVLGPAFDVDTSEPGDCLYCAQSGFGRNAAI